MGFNAFTPTVVETFKNYKSFSLHELFCFHFWFSGERDTSLNFRNVFENDDFADQEHVQNQ